jgi:hypothetical protein
MAIINSIQKVMAGFGTGAGAGGYPGGYATASTVAISGTTTTTITTPVLGAQGYTNGKIRVKVYNGGGTSPTASISVDVSDGTNDFTVYPASAATAIATGTTGGVDVLIDLNVDIEISTVNIVLTLGGTDPTVDLDYEICLNP